MSKFRKTATSLCSFIRPHDLVDSDGEKKKTSGEGHSRKVFPALPRRHNVKSRWEKPLLAPAKVDSGALNMK